MLLSKTHSKFNFLLILYGLVFGVIFYDILGANFNITIIDELFVLILFLYSVIRNKISKEFIVFVCISIFYLIYSMQILVNIKPAIWLDFFIQIKPYIAFYCAYSLDYSLDSKYYKIIRGICILFAIVLFPIGIIGESLICYLFFHPSRYATLCVILGSLYFYCSPRNDKARNVCFVIMSIGLLSFRSKIYGELVVAFILFYLYYSKKIKLSLKAIIAIIITCTVVIYVAWEKISFYFVTGVQRENMFARPLLYYESINVFNDYIPFGSGFGTYATYASAQYYSPLYYKYGLIYNPEIGNGKFISDTFYPALCQFGYVGLFLYFVFWYMIFKKAHNKYLYSSDATTFKFTIFIIAFFFIESFVDSTFTHNRGVFLLVLLAMYINSMRSIHSRAN